MAKSSAPSNTSTSGLPIGPDVRIAMLIGKDLFARHENTQLLRAAAQAKFIDIDDVNFDGLLHQAADILDECRSFGLIAAHKLVIIDNAEGVIREETRPLFEKYAKSPSPGTTLIIRAAALISGNLGKAIEQVGCIVKCEPPTAQFALQWVLAQCEVRHNAAIEKNAAELLVELVGPAMAQLDTELAKLAAAAGDERKITRELVTTFVGRSKEEEIWAIQGRILRATRPERLAEIRQAIEVLRIHPTMVLFAFTDLAKKLHSASRGIKSGVNPQQIKTRLKLWGEGGEQLLALAAQTDWKLCLALLRHCVEADRRFKSGLGDAERSAEILSMRFPKAPKIASTSSRW